VTARRRAKKVKPKDGRRGILLRLDPRQEQKLNQLVAARATKGETPSYQATLVALIEEATG